MNRLRSQLIACTLLVAATFFPLLAVAPPADAQAPVTGAADFRNAPQLPPGTYSDSIVSGDSAWYAVVYTNGTPYEFEVSISGSAPSGLELVASFVAPTLDTVDGPAPFLQGSGASYPDGHTNVWFLKVSLTTSGQPGVEYPVTVTVGGVQSLGREPCGQTPGCTLDNEYADIIADLNLARSQLDDALQTTEAVQSEINNGAGILSSAKTVKPQLQARLSQAEASMAELCAPDQMCDTFPDPGSKTPVLGWIVGLGVLGLGGFSAFKKFTSNDEEDDDDDKGSKKNGSDEHTPASLSADRFAQPKSFGMPT